MTPEERRAFDAKINELIGKAGQNIAQARSRGLNEDQKQALARAESFMAQAQEVRAADPEAAQSLAERAELLTREVLGQK
jgi:hypothetical protein